MVESEHDIALQDTDRIEGRSALVNNVNAAIALAGAVRSTLGPRGADKMLVDENGSVLVTNDGVTVLETAKVEHPTANLLISTSSAQDRVARDGTTTSILLTAELLRNALEISRIGVHPSLIMKGYQIACEESMKQIDIISRNANVEQMEAVISTTLAGKVDSSLSVKMTKLAL
jgi:chaperonin GroEL (HSP60 family)